MVATGASTLGPVLQQGCSPGPRWHSPALFLQQAIPASVIWLFGRQASAGAIVHKNSKLKTAMGRTFAIHRCYNSLFLSCKFTARDAELKNHSQRIIYVDRQYVDRKYIDRKLCVLASFAVIYFTWMQRFVHRHGRPCWHSRLFILSGARPSWPFE